MPKRPSASRAWCKICHVWIADNKIQKQQHEQAAKHKAARATLLKEIAEKNEKKAQEEAKAAASASGQTGGGKAAGKSAAVAQQLLETAAGTTANKYTQRQGVKKRPRESGAQGDAEETETSGGAAALKPAVGEELDANGFPLPASVVYGQWQSVTQDDREQVDEAEHLYWGQGRAGTEDGDEKSSKRSEYGGYKANEAAEKDVWGMEEDGDDETRGEVEGAFKRRAAPRTRRVRRKTTVR